MRNRTVLLRVHRYVRAESFWFKDGLGNMSQTGNGEGQWKRCAIGKTTGGKSTPNDLYKIMVCCNESNEFKNTSKRSLDVMRYLPTFVEYSPHA